MTPNTLHPAWLVGVAVAFALIPIVLGLFTAYVKISVVLGMLRSALGTQHTPSGLVVMALSLSLTGFTMAPVLEQCAQKLGEVNLQPIIAAPSRAGLLQLQEVVTPLRSFLETHAGTREVTALIALSEDKQRTTESSEAQKVNELSLRILLPAFVLTELKEAFAMAFVLLLPFLIIDLIVANLLVGMGMMMVSPTLVALPVKVILLVMSDGWLLIAKGLLQSYQ